MNSVSWTSKEWFSEKVRGDQKTWDSVLLPFNLFEWQFPLLERRYNSVCLITSMYFCENQMRYRRSIYTIKNFTVESMAAITDIIIFNWSSNPLKCFLPVTWTANTLFLCKEFILKSWTIFWVETVSQNMSWSQKMSGELGCSWLSRVISDHFQSVGRKLHRGQCTPTDHFLVVQAHVLWSGAWLQRP